MLSNVSLKKKILVGGLLPLLLIGLVNVVGLINFNGVIESYQWVSITNKVIEMGGNIEKSALNMQTGERGYLLTGNKEFLEPYTNGVQNYKQIFKELKALITIKESLDAITDAEEILDGWKINIAEPFIQRRSSLDNTPDNLKIISDMVSTEKGKEYFEKYRQKMNIFEKNEKNILQERTKDADDVATTTNYIIIFGTATVVILALFISMFFVKMITNPILKIKEAALKIGKGDIDVAIDIESHDEVGEMAKAFMAMSERLNKMSRIAHQIGEGNFNITVEKYSDKDILGNSFEDMIKNLNNIARIAHQIGQGNLNVTFTKRSDNDILGNAFEDMIKNLNNIASVAHQIGQGDLNIKFTKRSDNDLLGVALENMLSNLNTIMFELKHGILSLNSATTEILATTTEVASGASQTSSAVAQTSASIEEIKQTAKSSSAKAVQTAESTSKAIEIAKSGTLGLIENMQGLAQIKEKMDLIASNIILLSQQSQQIGEITSTVEDIANQSNMLAVNASIEAIKAGEQGKGFSIVALELKNLSEQSKQGAKQVQKILTDIQKVTGTLVMAAEQGAKAVERGVKQAQSAKNSMDQLNTTVQSAANAGKQIAASYEQELAGMDQISGAMNSVREATIQNLSSIKQVEESAHDLNTLSQKLREIMEHYTIAENKR